MEDYDRSPELSGWCLVEAMHVHPEAFVQGCGYYCRRHTVHYKEQGPKVEVCGHTARCVIDQVTGDPKVSEHDTSAKCVKAIGKDIIVLMAPEFMDVPEAHYIE